MDRGSWASVFLVAGELAFFSRRPLMSGARLSKMKTMSDDESGGILVRLIDSKYSSTYFVGRREEKNVSNKAAS